MKISLLLLYDMKYIIQYSCKEVQVRVNNYIFQVIQAKNQTICFGWSSFSYYEIYVNVFYIHYLTMIGHLLNNPVNIYSNI